MGYRPGHSAASSAADLRGVCAVGSNFAVGRTRPGPGPVDLPAYFTGARRTDPGALTGGSRQRVQRSEEHTSELQSLMRISYAVFCLKKKKTRTKKEYLSQNATKTL